MNARVKSLCRYILPSVGGLFVAYLYNVVDGIFVGQGVGDTALGAVNIAVHFITSMVAIVAMFPMGGATVAAIRMGRGDKQGANNAFMTSFSLTTIISILLTVIGMVFAPEIIDISGGIGLSAEMKTMATEYLFYYAAFSFPMLMSNCMTVFVRNDGAPILAFIGMCGGAVVNIFLDWLFIYPLGLGIIGAAVASGLGQVVSFVVLLSHFIRKQGDLRISKFSVQASLCGKVCKRGAPEAITQLTTPVTALCYNLALASLIGDIGVSTFSVLSFIFSLVNAILSGVAQGLQPLWGNSFGKQDEKEIRVYFRCGLLINFVLSAIIVGGLFVFDEGAVRIFNQEPDLVAVASKALPVFALSFIPMGINLICTSLLYSTKKTLQSNVIAISRGIVMKAAAIFLTPVIFGTESIWTAPFVAEIITLFLAVILVKAKRRKKDETPLDFSIDRLSTS